MARHSVQAKLLFIALGGAIWQLNQRSHRAYTAISVVSVLSVKCTVGSNPVRLRERIALSKSGAHPSHGHRAMGFLEVSFLAVCASRQSSGLA
jgi:hypothetical protein